MLFKVSERCTQTQEEFSDFQNRSGFVFLDTINMKIVAEYHCARFIRTVLEYLHCHYRTNHIAEQIEAPFTDPRQNNYQKVFHLFRMLGEIAPLLGVSPENFVIGYPEQLNELGGHRYYLYMWHISEHRRNISLVTNARFYNDLVDSFLRYVNDNYDVDWSLLGESCFIGNHGDEADNVESPEPTVLVDRSGRSISLHWEYTHKLERNKENLLAILDWFAANVERFNREEYCFTCGYEGEFELYNSACAEEPDQPVAPLPHIAEHYLSKHLPENADDKNACKQLILTGAPGTGKTYSTQAYAAWMLNSDAGNTAALQEHPQYCFVQFHSSYDYSDFVEGLRPVNMGTEENPQTTFVRVDGIFKEFCRKAAANPDALYYFIIDEINRADLSRVFGELMFCLEESHRGECVRTQYHNLPTYQVDADGKPSVIQNDVFANGFYIPENIIIIGTMNDIDRSVESFDFALRRRFRWVEVRADAVMEAALTAMNGQRDANDRLEEAAIDDLVNRIRKLNDTISSEDGGEKFGLNDAYHIGPAYFKRWTKDTSPEDYFDAELSLLIRQYVLGRRGTDDFLKKCRAAFTGDAQ